RDVPDGAGHDGSLFGLLRAETDLHGKLYSVLAQAVQLQPRSHRPRMRVVEKTRAMPGVFDPQTLGHEDLHRLADKLLTGVAKQLFRLGVHQNDLPLRAYDDNGVGRRFEKRAESAVGDLAPPHAIHRHRLTSHQEARKIRTITYALHSLEAESSLSVSCNREIRGKLFSVANDRFS